MRRTLFATVSVLGLTQAYAADISRPSSYPTKAPPADAYLSPWDGAYIGVNAGYAWGRSDYNVDGNTGTIPSSSPIYGVQAGAMKQYGTWVLGVEADWDIVNSTSVLAVPGFVRQMDKSEWVSTARVRAGYLIAPLWLVYATGGIGVGESHDTQVGATSTLYGAAWVAGGGVEYAISPNWHIGVEYLHANDLGTTFNLPGARGVSQFTSTTGTSDSARAKLNFKF